MTRLHDTMPPRKGVSDLLMADGTSWRTPAIVGAGLLLTAIVWILVGYQFGFPESIASRVDFVAAVNTGEEWLQANIKWLTRGIALYVTGFIEQVELFLWLKPWPLVVVALGLLGLRYGGLRFSLFVVLAVMFWGMVDMWDPAMSTLALMGVSVAISIILGIPLGVWCSQNDTVEAIVRPILDTMQTMPAFVYLLPAIFFFGVGETGAAMAIIIYAMPPVVRLTNLGIRQVPATTTEVAASFGSTRFQTLLKVQLPQAIPSIIMGVNQTIMMALGLAVLAVFIGAGGLGREVYSALTRLKVGWAFEAGMSIVMMAIIFDRLTLAMSQPPSSGRLTDKTELRFRLLPQGWSRFGAATAIESGIDVVWRGVAMFSDRLTRWFALAISRVLALVHDGRAQAFSDWLIRARFLFVSVLILAGIYLWDLVISPVGYFPESLQFTIREPIDNAVNWLAVNPYFAAFSKFLRATIYLYLLNPLDQLLIGLPWFYLLGAIFLMAWSAGGLTFATVATLMLFATGVAGLWVPMLETMSATVTSVAICVLFGLPLGVFAAYNRTVDGFVRPILDTMQTMPAFVYLIPVLMLFGGNKVTAIIATVIYAIPPMVRMTTLGLRQLPEQVNEVCQSFGSTGLQSLIKVKLPMASPSIMLGINQAIIMALAMQVITPMVAGEGLGKVVFEAMTVADTGKGLVAGTGIVLLAIVLDRLTQAWTAQQRKALGL